MLLMFPRGRRPKRRDRTTELSGTPIGGGTDEIMKEILGRSMGL
jgi:hypothetical protein